MAIGTFGYSLRTQQVLMHTDNMAIKLCVEKGKSKASEIMSLIRVILLHKQVEYESCHVYSHMNGIADALSRGRLEVFYSMHPNANRRMFRPLRVKLDF